MSSALIELNNIQLQVQRQTILESINLQIDSAQIVSIIGPNGAGKTSLLRIVLGLQQASGGTIKRQAQLKTAYMPQRFEVNSHLPLSVEEFLRLKTEDFDRDIIDCLGLKSRLNSPLHTSSGGELQRILLARAVMQQPQLLVLDEPAQGVDVHGQAQLYAILENFRQQYGCAILMVSHDLHIVMAKTDAVICLNQHICCQGHPQEISQHPEYIALFGSAHADTLAVYNHHHDHHHDLSGEPHHRTCTNDDCQP